MNILMFFFRINTLLIFFFRKRLLNINSLYNFGPLKNIVFFNLFDFISGRINLFCSLFNLKYEL